VAWNNAYAAYAPSATAFTICVGGPATCYTVVVSISGSSEDISSAFSGAPSPPSGGGVPSVFGRSGAVVAATGDYTAAQVTNAAATDASNTFAASQTINNPSSGPGITVNNAATGTNEDMAFLQSGQTSGTGYFLFGQSASTNNAMQIDFSYSGDGSTSNSGAFSLYGNSAALGFDAGGNVSILSKLITPSLASASGASNSDLRGYLTLVSGTATYTFGGTYTVAPISVATDTTAATAVQASATTTVLTLHQGTSTDVINYVCVD
jgi:hypothetical protein